MSYELGSKSKKLFSGVKGYNPFMKTVISISSFNKSQTAQYRLRAIDYYQEFGLKATLSAFPVKRSTLFLWQKKLKDGRGRLISLIPKSTRPGCTRRMNTHPLVLAEICRWRKKHYRLGKHKLLLFGSFLNIKIVYQFYRHQIIPQTKHLFYFNKSTASTIKFIGLVFILSVIIIFYLLTQKMPSYSSFFH